MALTQMQIIQSLGDAMSWFQRELEWDVAPGELRHLCGRIGELYAALITNGQMASGTNQKGYDVVSKEGERISVKTTTMLGNGGHVSFNPRTLELVDRVIILRVNTEEMQVETLLDAGIADAKLLMRDVAGEGMAISLSKLARSNVARAAIETVHEVVYKGIVIRELESGTIEADQHGQPILPVKRLLRMLARELSVSIVNGNGNELNTRQLGTLVIKTIEQLESVNMAGQATA